MTNNTQRKDIFSLLALMGTAILVAILLSVVIVMLYGPTGRYSVNTALLAPELIPTLSYNDTNNKTGGSSRFVFDSIEFTFPDASLKQQNLQIDPNQYSRFYQLIASDKSLLDPPPEVISLFTHDPLASIAIKVRTESHAKWQDETKLFQQIDIVNDYFRVSLHEEVLTGNWVYFYHPQIYQKTLNLFIPKPNL